MWLRPTARIPRACLPFFPAVISLSLLTCIALCPCACRQARDARDADAIIRSAWQNFHLGEYSLAVGEFEAAAGLLPDGDTRRLQAQYGLATTWNLRLPITEQDKDLACTLYECVIAQAPDHDLAAWSQLALARMKHLVPVGEDPDYAAVRQAYREVINRYPDHLAAEEAFVYLQSTHVAAMDQDESRVAAAALEAFVAAKPDSGFISAAHSLLAVCYETLREPENRLKAEIAAFRTAEVDPANPFHEDSWSYWKIATVAEFEAGDFATAREYYRRLIKEYPQDIRKYAAEQALARMDALEAEVAANER